MDLAAVILPGAQSVASAILTDAWNAARAALTRAVTRSSRTQPPGGEQDPADSAGRELDVARRQSLEIAGEGTAEERRTRMELFWAGYLTALARTHPELLDVLAELPGLLAGTGSAPGIETTTHNAVSGTVHGSVVQAGSITGPITFGKA